MKTRQKILVYLFGSLGDSIVAIPALRAVRRHFPDAEVVMLQNFMAGDIVKASQVIPDEFVSRYLSYESTRDRFGKLSNFFRLWLNLRRERFDAAVYLIMSERTKKDVWRDRLFFRSSGIKKLYGFHPFSDDELYPFDPDGHPAMTEHEALRKLKRLAVDDIEYSPKSDLRTPLLTFHDSDTEKIDRWLGEKRRKTGVPLISLAPGCKSQANAWPVENFVQLGSRLIAEVNCEIIVVGGKPEHELGEKLVAAWGGGINAAGAFSVKESSVLLSKCNLHIGLDTGTMHLAAAAGTRCFAIFGERSNPGLWYPLGGGHTVLYHPVECAGCHFQTCPLPDHPCMKGISFETVWDNLKQFLEEHGHSENSDVRVISV